MVMMTAITPSEKASSRAVEVGFWGIRKDYQSIGEEEAQFERNLRQRTGRLGGCGAKPAVQVLEYGFWFSTLVLISTRIEY